KGTDSGFSRRFYDHRWTGIEDRSLWRICGRLTAWDRWMDDVWHGRFRNTLLRRLPKASRQRFAARLECVDLPRSYQLSPPHQPMEHAYFLREASHPSSSARRRGSIAKSGSSERTACVRYRRSLISTPTHSSSWLHR